MHIQFQTNDLIPPPYAHAIEIQLSEDKNNLKVDFELSYLDRDGLDEEEILEEGFTENDDLKWSGALNENWLHYFESFKEGLELKKKTELSSGEDFWNVETENKKGYPVLQDFVSQFIQEIQQAAFEAAEREAPLHIQIHRISNETEKLYTFRASFKDRIYSEESGGNSVSHKWDDLNPFLKDLFSGEFRPDQAAEKQPKKSGLYVNLGDNLWYELGKSYLIQPSKIQKYLN